MNKPVSFFRLAAFSVLCVVHTAYAWEQTASPAYPLTFEGALETALYNRIELKIQQKELQRADAGIKEARGALLPTVDLLANAQRTVQYDKLTDITAEVPTSSGVFPVRVSQTPSPYQTSSALEVGFNLYKGGADYARIQQMTGMKRAGEAQEAAMRRNIILEVATAYWNLRKTEISNEQARRGLELAQKDLSITSTAYQNGRVAKIELDEKVLAVEMKRMNLRTAARRLSDERRNYVAAVGIEFGNTEENRPALTDTPDSVDLRKITANWLSIEPPTLQEAMANLETALANIKSIEAEYKPTIDLFVRYSGVGRSENELRDAFSDFGRNKMMVGLRFRWNLFSGFQTSQRMYQAAAHAELKKLQIEKVKRELTNQWMDKSAREIEIEDQLALANRQLELSRDKLEIAKTQMRLHKISDLNFEYVKLDYSEAEMRVAQLRIDLLMARLSLELSRVS